METKDVSLPANEDGTYSKHQWENRTVQLQDYQKRLVAAEQAVVALKTEMADQIAKMQQANKELASKKEEIVQENIRLQTMFTLTLAHVGMAWDALGGDTAEKERRKAELLSQKKALDEKLALEHGMEV